MKHVVVTGASSGIGSELAKTFAFKGWRVTLVARNEERLATLQNSLENTRYLVCDLTQPDQIQNLKDQIDGDVDALINNAGMYRPCSVDKDNDEVWDIHYTNNLMSAVRLTRLVWENLKITKGSILNISSTLAVRPIPKTAAYSAMKAAMNNWTQSLALEGAPFGIRANTICPGLVDTPIHSYVGSERPEDIALYKSLQNIQPLGRTGTPKDIAGLAFQLCSDESSWITGAIIPIDGGILLKS